MSFDIENFLSPTSLHVLQKAGLHKVAGAMVGTDELTAKEAAAIIGAKAYLRRRETQKIAQGLYDLAAVAGEKVAENPWAALGQHMLLPAVGGAGIAMLPKLMSDQPLQEGELLQSGLMGGALGAAGGAGAGMFRGFKADPAMADNFGRVLTGIRNPRVS